MWNRFRARWNRRADAIQWKSLKVPMPLSAITTFHSIQVHFLLALFAMAPISVFYRMVSFVVVVVLSMTFTVFFSPCCIEPIISIHNTLATNQAPPEWTGLRG